MSRRTIFVLGAGASKDAGAPLMSDFLDAADAIRNRQDGSIQPNSNLDEQFKLVFSAIAQRQGVFAKSTLELDNIESIFAAFEMAELFGRLGSLKRAEVDRLTTAIKSVIVTTLEKTLKFPVSKGSIQPPTPYREFADLVRDLSGHFPVTVMTFNYEIAIDYALQYASIPINYCLESGTSASYVSLLKLHGSLNWTRCPACGQIAVLRLEDWLSRKTYMGGEGRHSLNELGATSMR